MTVLNKKIHIARHLITGSKNNVTQIETTGKPPEGI